MEQTALTPVGVMDDVDEDCWERLTSQPVGDDVVDWNVCRMIIPDVCGTIIPGDGWR